MARFREGQLVMYQNGDRVEIGKIKRIVGDSHAFVWYHAGDTAASTKLTDLKPIENAYCISGTHLGGNDNR